MSKTTQMEYATADIPTQIWVAKARHADGGDEGMTSISEKIGSGRAFLEVVAYPWGVEFEVHDAEEVQ